MKFLRRGEVFWVNLDPTIGTEINKIRPCVIVSNDIANEYSSRVIVAPITTKTKKVYPFEVELEIQDKKCKIMLDQIRALDKSRLSKKLITCSDEIIEAIDKALKIALALK